MSNLEQALILGTCFAGLAGFGYSSYFLLKVSGTTGLRWREWISLSAILLVTVAGLFRLVMPAFWGTDFGSQVRVAETCTKVSVRICTAALVLGVLGRPRLIVPIALASIGTATFWVMSTIP